MLHVLLALALVVTTARMLGTLLRSALTAGHRRDSRGYLARPLAFGAYCAGGL